MKTQYYYIVLITILITGCKSGNDMDSKEISFMPDIFPYVDTIYAKHNNQQQFYKLGLSNNKKIIFYTNGDCGTCFHQIVQWQEFINNYSEQIYGVDYVIVIQTEVLPRLEYNLERIDNSIPIYIDTMQCFSVYNNMPTINPQILVLDEQNVVIYYAENEFDQKKILKILK
ncbi:MAG: hypothetical protein IJ383_04410 [Bacteroidales bacterium]|nr:hypothetical protein [Bacteroidales bacterium]